MEPGLSYSICCKFCIFCSTLRCFAIDHVAAQLRCFKFDKENDSGFLLRSHYRVHFPASPSHLFHQLQF